MHFIYQIKIDGKCFHVGKENFFSSKSQGYFLNSIAAIILSLLLSLFKAGPQSTIWEVMPIPDSAPDSQCTGFLLECSLEELKSTSLKRKLQKLMALCCDLS